MTVYMSEPFRASEDTLVSNGEGAEPAPTRSFGVDPTVQTDPLNGTVSICTTGPGTEASDAENMPSPHTPSNLAPESSRQPRRLSVTGSLRSFSRSPSRSGRGLRAVRPGKQGAVSAAVTSVLKTARIEPPELKTISDEMLKLLNEVLKGKGDEFEDIPLGEKHVVTFLKVSKHGYVLKRLDDDAECPEWQYLIVPEGLSIDKAGDRINRTAAIDKAYLAVPNTTPGCKYATCCIQENSINRWHIVIQNLIVTEKQTIHEVADLDRSLALCMTKRFAFTLYAHPDAV